jgi:oleandomycin transport system ATP-binding protein
MAGMSYAIQARGLVKRFGATTALAGVDFEMAQGTVLGLLGPNGSGKTTTVRILATLVRPDAGRAEIGGYDCVRQAHQVRRLIGLTGQFAAVDDNLSGHENLLMIGRLTGLSTRDARARAAELLERFELAGAARRPVKTYSGGMRRRLDLALSLAGRPRVLFLDEPTTGLDPQSRSELWTIVRDLVGEGTTVLLTTQYLEEADRLADDIVVLDHGSAIARGTPDALKAGVSGKVLEVRPVDAARLGAVAAIVGDLVAVAPEVHVDTSTVTAPMSDSILLGEVVRRLDAAGVVLADLSLRGPSLDEVFLALTGRRAEPEPSTRKEEIAV